MCGLAAIMIIGGYIGLAIFIYCVIRNLWLENKKFKEALSPKKEDEEPGCKVVEPVDPSIVIEKHTLLSKINKMLNACEDQRQKLIDNNQQYHDEGYYLNRELTTVIDAYKEIKQIEINDRLSLDYATFLFNDGKLRNQEEIDKFEEKANQIKYVSSNEYLADILECGEDFYYKDLAITGLLLFIAGLIPSLFYGFIEAKDKGFWIGMFSWQWEIIGYALNAFEGGLVGEFLRAFLILPFILAAPFFIGAFVFLHMFIQSSYNIKLNVYRKKAGFKEKIDKNTIIAGVACIPTLIQLFRG